MKADTWRDKVLLDSSGELPDAAHLELVGERRNDPLLEEFAAEALRLMTLAERTLPGAEGPGPAALAAIRAAAAERPPEVRWWALRMNRVLAYAALLAVAVGSWFMVATRGGSGSVPVASRGSERLESLGAIVAMASEGEADQAQVSGDSAKALGLGQGEEAEIHLLALQLLRMQGMEVELWDRVEGDWMATPDEEPSPTTLRGHSTPGVPAPEYG